MTKETYNALQQAALLGTMCDDINPVFIFSLTNSTLLLQIAKGELDARELARLQLANRGLSVVDGSFVGFKKAKELILTPYNPAT